MGRAPGAGFWDSPCDAASSSARIVCKINVALEVMAVGLQTSMDGLEAEESAANGQGGGGHKHDPNLFHAHSGQAPEQNETRNRIKTTKHSGLLAYYCYLIVRPPWLRCFLCGVSGSTVVVILS